jgi:D-alanine-D-alanine ligase
VIGNTTIEVTRPGETIHAGQFYDFEAKYVSAVDLRCPADLPEAVTRTTMEYAREAYLAIGCRGMARVDLFYLERTGEVLVNEINTIPGMTSQSMFWVVWETEGLSRTALLDRILGLALEASEAAGRFAP